MKKISVLALTAFLTVVGGCENESVETIDIYTTTADRSKELDYEIMSFYEGDLKSTDQVLKLDTSVRYQQMDGFGAAITGATAYNLMRMTPENRSAFLYETFSPDKMGFGYVRIAIGCSDFSISEYTCCDRKGIKNFALTAEETKYIIPILKEILRIYPSLKIMGTPWTCPRWMKVSDLKRKRYYNKWEGGQLNPAYYNDYAEYFVKWIQAFEAEGVPIYSVTPQNEPLNESNSVSLYMTWQEQLAFVKKALGPQIRAAGLNTKIYAYDHNYDYDGIADQQDYPMHLYADPEASSFLAGAAYHGYSGDKSELNRVHEAYPKKELVFTGASVGEWNDGRNLEFRLLEDMREIGLGTVNNRSVAVIVSNLMLNTAHGPSRPNGCQNCYGSVDLDSTDYKTMKRNSLYFVIAHLASVAKPGAIRIGGEGNLSSGITYSAFQNTDGSYGLTVLNESQTRQTFYVTEGERVIRCNLPARSVVSYRWNHNP